MKKSGAHADKDPSEGRMHDIIAQLSEFLTDNSYLHWG